MDVHEHQRSAKRHLSDDDSERRTRREIEELLANLYARTKEMEDRLERILHDKDDEEDSPSEPV